MKNRLSSIYTLLISGTLIGEETVIFSSSTQYFVEYIGIFKYILCVPGREGIRLTLHSTLGIILRKAMPRRVEFLARIVFFLQ